MKPVAWRVKDFADGWILCHTLKQAKREADGAGNLIEPLFLGGDLVGTKEAAKILRTKKSNFVRDHASSRNFPTPISELACGRIWLKQDVQRYAKWHLVHKDR